MALEPKIAERIAKLLRLAAPSSGTTEGERASAALEAAKLIAEHKLVVAEPQPVEKPRQRRARPRSRPADRPTRPSAPSRDMYVQVDPLDEWAEVDVMSPTKCAKCHSWIMYEAIYSFRTGEHRHLDCFTL